MTSVKIECPCCFKRSRHEELISFERFWHYVGGKVALLGVPCPWCGYIVSTRTARQLERLPAPRPEHIQYPLMFDDLYYRG